ncbi:tRNA (adenosine(37)-N6)-threonylcarbamoyltransferase complex ATPase subunit type 1 TsaE [Candidatus Peregrinibacteria bacterium]|nr:tRNA (adenosine(37)-N6)-threonylcarbamoyltransferase complex ATPase subunit type 1 TsaE [Candidatus Peregrinibacteria bacterium]
MFLEYHTTSAAQTIELGKQLAQRLTGGDTVLLSGDLGSGKTHFIKGLAQGLGIFMTIKSPTYAYVNQYPIQKSGLRNQDSEISRGKMVFHHYDLYRLNAGDDFSSIGLEESLSDPQAINAVEWAERLEGQYPQRTVSVNLSGAGDDRIVRIEFQSPTVLGENSIEAYYEEWATPPNVRQHCRRVAQVSMTIAQAYARKGEILNSTLLYVGALLHDMARVCDFRSMERSSFKVPISDDQWNQWLKLREIHKGEKHAFIAHEQLMSRGFTETATLIRSHEADLLVLEPDNYDTLEKKILYYADKRVKHDEVVDLAERFRDGRARYGDGDTPEQKKLYRDVEFYSMALEKSLFDGLDIRPDDITSERLWSPY